MRFYRMLFSFLGVLAIQTSVHAQANGGADVKSFSDERRLNDEIARFNSDTDKVMKCTYAISIFRKEFERDPSNALAALYLGRAYDNVASIGEFCQIADAEFIAYSDSALRYFHLADKLQPGIKEQKFGFSIPVMIGHLYGSRCLWKVKHADYNGAREELAHGMKEGGYTPAQVEVCRLVLDLCDKDAIFFSTGDDDTFPIMYLQMVEGYRTDVSVINLSLINMTWYFKLFLTKEAKGFTPVSTTLSKQDIDSFETVVTKKDMPDRLYTDVDAKTRTRIHKELGVDVGAKAEICFPVYQQYEEGYYTYAVHKALASILLANQWKRRVFFGIGGLESILNCRHVAVRNAGLVEELYPIDFEQAEHFSKGGDWFHEEKMNQVFLHDAKIEKFSETQPSSGAQIMLYFGMAQYLVSMDPKDKSIGDVIQKIRNIPLATLAGSEKTIFSCAQVIFNAGFKAEAQRICAEILPVFEKNISSVKTSITQDDADYLIALVIAGQCPKGIAFINSFEVSNEIKKQMLNKIKEYYGCK